LKFFSLNRRDRLSQHTFWYVVSRIVWTLLFLVHIIPVVAVSSRIATAPSLKNCLSLLLLLGIMALSALKALDVKWMRLRLRSKGWCALVLVALLIHGDFVGSKLPDFIVLESSITLIAAMTLLNRRYLKSIQKLLTAWVLQLSQAFNSWLEEVFVAQVLPHGFALSVPRGPPSR
jgi:hypothetical protein